MRRIPAVLLVLPLLLPAMLPACAQPASARPAPVVRYHFGDDSRWSSPSFDDGDWPVAVNGFVPSVAGHVDSFLWVRMRVPVPAGLQAPMALHLTGLGLQPTAWQAFVNGHPVGGQGSFPPRTDPAAVPVSPVMALPFGLTPTETTTLVALREWQGPSFFETHVPSHPAAVIDEARVLELAVRARTAESLTENAPEDALSALLALVGVALLGFSRSSRRREYLWAAIFLLSPLATAIFSSGPVVSRLSLHAMTLAWAAVYASGLIAEIEFMWALFKLRSRPLHFLWHALWVAFIAAQVAEAWFLGSFAIERLCRIVIVSLVPAFDAILFPVCIREMFRRGGERAFAAAMCVMELTIGLATLGYSVHVALGPFTLNLFLLTVTLVDLTIAGLLIRRAVQAWREANTLRVEFEAAREVQLRLVTAPPAVPGFRIESAYLPATQVGGDFYRVLPGEHGAVLVLVGDVSGKGLRAAMTVSAIVGSLRMMSTCDPAEILRRLNQSLCGNLPGGFVTCLAARLHAEGSCAIANAGHLAPYRNGEELAVAPGLPLGIAPSADYAATAFHLDPGDTLTFVSDGVVEARNASGELFGFERAADISTQAAGEIARAAQHFGQEDDITVLTVAFAGAVAIHA
jgi:phosphoserine phosphatase RsbU/P